MTIYVLNAILVNATFRSALSNVILDENQAWLFGDLLGSLDALDFYELWVIPTAAVASEKFWSPKSYPSFNAFLEPYCNSKMLVHTLLGMFPLQNHQIPWCTYSPEVSPIEYVRNFDDLCLARPVTDTVELWVQKHSKMVSLKYRFKICWIRCHVITAHGGFTKY